MAEPITDATPCSSEGPPRTQPRASVIELIAPDFIPSEDGAGSIVVPREVRINGVSVLTAGSSGRVLIGDIRLGSDLVTVTVTLVARRLVIAADGDLDGLSDADAVPVDSSELEDGSLRDQLDEARQWARHGYEIGQRHCSWSDHGVAPAWLTEGWPPHIDSCEHLKHAADLDTALSRVRGLSVEPEVMNAQQEHPGVWKRGYKCGVLAAKSATRPRDEETEKP
jgi:hypothetical protein